MSFSFFSELQRRNVFKVAAAYLILAWVVIQVADTAVPALHLPEWVNTLVFLLGALGFPFVLFFAWVFEITPEGVRREVDIKPEESITAHTGQKLNHMIIALLVIALAYFIYESRFQETVVEPQQMTDEAGNASIAVLPFVNMSADPNQDYFSDGISEEILNVLTKIPNLHITSRSSAFSFKGKDLKLSEIAKELGVANILEGSVRKSGNKIRITAQLIEASSDKHLWSETYDRDLSDIFAVQDEISAAIVVALKDKLGLEEEELNLNHSITTIDPEAYDHYLHGLEGINEFTFASLMTAEHAFAEALKLEPSYQAARVGFASAKVMQVTTGSVLDLSLLDEAESIIKKVLLSEPNNAMAYKVLSEIAVNRGDQKAAKKHIETAYRLNPNEALIITEYADIAALELGETKTRELFDRATRLDPLNAYVFFTKGRYLLRVTQTYDEVKEAFKRALKLKPENGNHSGYLAALHGFYLGDLVTAYKYSLQFQNIDMSDPDGPIYHSKLLHSLGDFETALDYANQAVGLMPNSGQGRFTKAAALTALDRKAEALQIIEESFANDKVVFRRESKRNMLFLGIDLFLDREAYDKAEALILMLYPEFKNIESIPTSVSVDETALVASQLAAVYRAMGDDEKAKELLRLNENLSELSFLRIQRQLTGGDYVNLATVSIGRLSENTILDYLEKSFESGLATDIRLAIFYNPVLRPLRGHPRFIALEEGINAEMARQLAIVQSE